jgi:hypothetical protein
MLVFAKRTLNLKITVPSLVNRQLGEIYTRPDTLILGEVSPHGANLAHLAANAKNSTAQHPALFTKRTVTDSAPSGIVAIAIAAGANVRNARMHFVAEVPGQCCTTLDLCTA